LTVSQYFQHGRVLNSIVNYSYDIFAINIASTMIGYVYGPGHKGLTHNQDLGLKVATPVGTLVGQLLFGWLADRVGRKKMCMSNSHLPPPSTLLISLQMVSSL
jgi:MFS family permease